MKDFIYYNLNPQQKHTGDCVVRAFAFFLGMTWKRAFLDLIMYCADKGVVNFNYRSTYYAYLQEKGYVKRKLFCTHKISVGEFCEKYAEEGKTYLIQVKGHMTIVCERDVYDTWDCRDRIMDFYWERDGGDKKAGL